MRTENWSQRAVVVGITLLCPLLLLGGADDVRVGGRLSVENGSDGNRLARRGAIAESGGRFVLRDVRVEERPVTVASSPRFRLEGIVEEVAGGVAGGQGDQPWTQEDQPQAGLMGGPRPPLVFSLAQNYPNPFNPATTITYSLPQGGHCRLSIFDVRGRLVRELVNDEMSEGSYSIRWDGRDGAGRAVGSGVYLYRLISGAEQETRRMLLVK